MIRRHLSYANVMSTLAVFLLMGGSAYALSRHSVGAKQLKKNAVTSKKIKDGAVTGPKIAAGAVTGSGLTVTTTSATGTAMPTTGSVGSATATCPGGKKAVSGGGLSDSANNGAFIEDSRPVTGSSGPLTASGGFTGWRVVWQNTTATPKTPTAFVVCLG